MNVFDIRQELMDSWRSYVESSIHIRDRDIQAFIEQEYNDERYWPEALVQLSPSFAGSSTVEALSKQGVVHSSLDSIFRVGKNPERGDPGQTLSLHRHQRDALSVAQTGNSYVLTTGTGSGKSLGYFIPIIDAIARSNSSGMQAIVVYPMNALCNSQFAELQKFLGDSDSSPITYAMYTGQNDTEERERIRSTPPNILLTNYVMLELLLTRGKDQPLIEKMGNLRFVVLDELHTYRGRQGADVAMLMRRLRNRVAAPNIQFIGTSATMVSEGDFDSRRSKVADVATALFGAPVAIENVIGETLEPFYEFSEISVDGLRASVTRVVGGALPDTAEEFLRDPLAAWIERTFGVELKDGRYERVVPRSISDGATQLSADIACTEDDARRAIEAMLLRGFQVLHPKNNRPIFAFRLHQFVSRGDTVYSTLELGANRHLTLDGQIEVPDDGDQPRSLYPVAFCRSCGEAYFTVTRRGAAHDFHLSQRTSLGRAIGDDDEQHGYVWLDARFASSPFVLDPDHVPDIYWDRPRKDGSIPLKKTLTSSVVPVDLSLDGSGHVLKGDGPAKAWFLQGSLRFCMNPECQQTWPPNTGEFTKLGQLASEGRAIATTLLTMRTVELLHKSQDISARARKILSFTDNRQDASLQAGHFNDFVTTAQLRAAVLVATGHDGSHDYATLPSAVLDAMALDPTDYAQNPALSPPARRNVREIMLKIIEYRLFQDLKRGWRVNQPNLEQLGLIDFSYRDLDELVVDEAGWAAASEHIRPPITGGRQPAEWDWLDSPELPRVLEMMRDLSPHDRMALLRPVLDHFRKEVSIGAQSLTEPDQTQTSTRARDALNSLWGLDQDEQMESSVPIQIVLSGKGRDNVKNLTPRSAVGKSLTLNIADGPKLEQRLLLLHVLVRMMVWYGLLKEIAPQRYMLDPATLRWRQPEARSSTDRSNAFYRDFYLALAGQMKHQFGATTISRMRAGEHTAQVPALVRQERERQFRFDQEPHLPVLFCSPTMELGVDISELNAVHMRNVPPTPANYAQRSGRAGRAGQPALVITYCSPRSPHDHYYFHHRKDMVSGVVTPPRIDLTNRDLIASHLRAVWLAESKIDFQSRLSDVLDIEQDDQPLTASVAASAANPSARINAIQRGLDIVQTLGVESDSTGWLDREWIADRINESPAELDAACQRWRDLFRAANLQRDIQNDRVVDPSLTPGERESARRLRDQAEQQLKQLQDPTDRDGDFSTYRYFASEGFLPGYSFPRLPLSAYIPGAYRQRESGVYLQRPRFIGISEFGPGNSIYYEGNRYRVESVTLPVTAQGSDQITTSIKVCEVCGYAHLGANLEADMCQNPDCQARLDTAFRQENFLRMQSVVTARAQRITSDEDERQRQGYDLRTAIRFHEVDGIPAIQRSSILVDQNPQASITFSPTATIWRMNLNWRRHGEDGSYGFWLDPVSGRWSRSGADDASPSQRPLVKVIPYVDDRQNALMLNLTDEPGTPARSDDAHGAIWSLAEALKRGICVRYQLEDSELGVELLPPDSDRPAILFTETAEGGAGVLRNLVEDPEALARVSESALETLHFDPKTGVDLAHTTCARACYHCLLSYRNQRLHEVLNRHLVRDLLLGWTHHAKVRAEAVAVSGEEQRDILLASAESSLEREFINWLYQRGYRLPDTAQHVLPAAMARPDFMFTRQVPAAIFIDGPVHHHSDVAERDDIVRRRLRKLGYRVVVFTLPHEWDQQIQPHTDLFGKGNG